MLLINAFSLAISAEKFIQKQIMKTNFFLRVIMDLSWTNHSFEMVLINESAATGSQNTLNDSFVNW